METWEVCLGRQSREATTTITVQASGEQNARAEARRIARAEGFPTHIAWARKEKGPPKQAQGTGGNAKPESLSPDPSG